MVIAHNSGCKAPLESCSQTHHEESLQQCRSDKGLVAFLFSQYPNRIDLRSGWRVGKEGKVTERRIWTWLNPTQSERTSY